MKTVLSLLVLMALSLTTHAKGVLCTLTDSNGKAVTKVGGFNESLTNTFIKFDRTEGYDVIISGVTHPKTPGLIYVTAQINDFSTPGEVHTSVSTAKNYLNVDAGSFKDSVERKIKIACEGK